MKSIQYTVRGVSSELDAELRKEARATGRTLNAVVVDTLAQAKLAPDAAHDDLDWFIGAGRHDPGGEQEDAQGWLDSLPAELA